ncbi:MAG: hypothetical protein EAZ07_03495 [Cytophagales bacterium]|nr:MAG: hypothetical protein EAZ07_03495 [Cytophagales bacterium]
MKKILVTIFVFITFGMMSLLAQTKKDGTPDKRFKENKEIKSPKLKADGTPDMRFKENKDTKKEIPKEKLKADGTPDKRFKENQKKEIKK